MKFKIKKWLLCIALCVSVCVLLFTAAVGGRLGCLRRANNEELYIHDQRWPLEACNHLASKLQRGPLQSSRH